MTTPFSPGDPNRPGNKALLAKLAALTALVATIVTVGVKATSAPAPVQPPPVVVDSTPRVDSGFAIAIVADSFSEYKNTAALLANISSLVGGTGDYHTVLYSDGLNGQLVSLDTTVKYNGHATMKYTQPGGVPSTPQLHVYFPTTTHIWYRVKVRFSPGWTTAGTIPPAQSSNAYKLISWGWSNGDDGSGRIEITNTTEYELYENVQTGPTAVGGENYLNAGNITTEWSDSAWYDYVVEVDHSQRVGVIRLWRGRDGTTPTYEGQATEAMFDSTSMMPPLTNISVGLNYNQIRAANQNQALWWGEWEVIDGAKHPNPFNLVAK